MFVSVSRLVVAVVCRAMYLTSTDVPVVQTRELEEAKQWRVDEPVNMNVKFVGPPVAPVTLR
jgi:hypothetical protein